MHHIKNILLKFNNFSKKKIIKTDKLLGPSLSILKPELTAIFSILNRILGIILIFILTLLPFILIFFQNINPYSIYSICFIILLLFIVIYHLLYGRLKLLLYVNKVYLLINSNIKQINNIYIIYSIFAIILIFLNLFIISYLFQINLDLNLTFSEYSFYFNCGVFFLILFYLKYKLNNFIIWCLTYNIKDYIITNYQATKNNVEILLEEDYRKEILPIIMEIKALQDDLRRIKSMIITEWHRWIRFLTH